MNLPDQDDLTNDQHYYSFGACHIFAIATQRMLGGSFLVIEDPEEVVWTSDDDPDDYRAAVLHVYTVVDGSDGPVAVDIFGERPQYLAAGEAKDFFGVFAVTEDQCPNEELLIEHYIDTEDDATKPLAAFSEEDIEAATAILRERYPPPSKPYGLPIP